MKITDIKSETNHANIAGMALRRPLFESAILCGRLTLTTPYDTTAKVIACYAAAFFIALLSIVPCSILWFAGKGISLLGNPSINPEGLSLAPPATTAPPPRRPQNLNTLYTANEARIPIPKRETFRTPCQIIQRRNSHALLPTDHATRELFLNEITLYLTNILTRLQDPSTSPAKQAEALTLLADGFLVCYPTWIEQTKKAYRVLSGQEETGEILLLHHIQQDKDDLILQFAQGKFKTEWHALNYVRFLLANQLGLSHDYQFDAYRGERDGIFGQGLCRWLFLQVYEDTNRLVTAIQTRINAAGYEGKYAVLLRDAVTQADCTIEDLNEYVLENYYEEDMTTLNRKGTIALLSLIGILH